MDNNIDFELIKRFLDGDERAFNELIKRYQSQIYWFARRMLGDHYEADEITQQTIIILYKKLETFRYDSALSTWIYRIVRNRTLNLIKLKKLKSFIGLDSDDVKNVSEKTDIIKNYEDRERIGKVKKILEKLPPRQREVFILRHFQDLSYDEIAKITKKSVGSLKASFHFATAKVEEYCKEEKS